MKKWTVVILWTSMALLLSGCWSKLELTERAFVLAIAIDKGKNDNLQMTLQIYKPVSQFGAPSVQEEKSAFFNVTLEGSSFFDIIRNYSTVTGRRSQFSHTQILLIGEEVAKEELSGILDFFFRDAEIRLNTSVMITEGNAREYLFGKTLIENTLGSQIKKQLNLSSGYAGKTIHMNLRDLAFQLKRESGIAMLPYIMKDSTFRQRLVQGIALVGKDRMIRRIEPDDAQYLLMLSGQLKSGIFEIPCDDASSKNRKETFEIMKLRTAMSPRMENHRISTHFDVQIIGSIGELVCTTIRVLEDEQNYLRKLERYMEKRLAEVLKTFQQEKVDVLGIGHHVYLHHPSQWKTMKPDWPERYAQMSADIRVKITSINSKMMNASPFDQAGEN